MVGERLKERMARLETLLGDWPEDEDTVTAFADSMKNEFEVQRNLMEASDKYAGEQIDALKTDLQALMAEYQEFSAVHGGRDLNPEKGCGPKSLYGVRSPT